MPRLFVPSVLNAQKSKQSKVVMKLKTSELSNGRYTNLSELALAMGLSIRQVYGVRQGKRANNERFIIGAIKAFPRYKLEDLFYVEGQWQKTAII